MSADVAYTDTFNTERFASSVLFFGAGYSVEREFGLDGGIVTALNGNIGQSGWILTGLVGYTDTDLNNPPAAPYDSSDISGSLLAGYQWVNPDYFLNLQAGVTVRHENANTGSSNDAGLIVSSAAATSAEDSLYGELNLAYVTIDNGFYGRGRAGWKFSPLTVGAEITYMDDDSSQSRTRYGAFVGDIPVGQFSMTLSAGYVERRDNAGDDGFYAQAEFSIPFGGTW
ncbi:cellulose biosynthesis protein BcsS [Hoeflea sp. G2-23]|uniref:Cellulose biosynthesis protein BcsS n=1 Tax=Hoeflea algicola TaxID=2983763 RepID=A0ABT3ZC70_9HYPH|nr:cellulose biosynthesis protein BcsS [Hoeflea algicola]MCY0149400.1 cellulose biosynthesis protein BcsS [Hoeflea algicola]